MADTKTKATAKTTETKEVKAPVEVKEETVQKTGLVDKVKAKLPTKEELKVKAKEIGKKVLKTGLVFGAGFATKAIIDGVSRRDAYYDDVDDEMDDEMELLADTSSTYEVMDLNEAK